MNQILMILLISLLIYAFYGYGLKSFGNLYRYTRFFRPAIKLSPFENEKITRLILAVLSQGIFLCLLKGLTAVDLRIWNNITHISMINILQGVLLGIAEMAVAGLFANILMQGFLLLPQKTGSGNENSWVAESGGGWILQYRRLVKHTPVFVFVPVILCYVGTEELIFRSLLINYTLSVSGCFALLFSTAWFAAVQAFGMPSFRSALFPVSGALLMGILHGIIYLETKNSIPLIIAHSVFFAVSMLAEKKHS